MIPVKKKTGSTLQEAEIEPNRRIGNYVLEIR